jgi:hypothetical protein
MFNRHNKREKTMKRKFTILLTVALLAFAFSGCSTKREAIGKEDEIIVVADSVNYLQLETTLLTVFSRIIYTPQDEILFKLKRIRYDDFEKYKKFKNILVVSPLNTRTNTTKYIKSILDSNVTKLVEEGKEFAFVKKDVWARHQIMVILTAPTIEELNKKILQDNENLLYYFRKASDDRIKAKLFKPEYEKKKIAARLLKEHGWTMYIQPDYWLAKDDSAHNFVWLRRAPNTDMERWIFVKWWNNASPKSLVRDSVTAMRNRVTKNYYVVDTSFITGEKAYVEIADDYRVTKEVNFNGRYAIMTQGLWRMNDKSMGGPFVNYVFYDEPTKRLYMIDGSIFAPKYYKKRLIQEVDILLHTFRTEHEMTKDEIEDLLDELD